MTVAHTCRQNKSHWIKLAATFPAAEAAGSWVLTPNIFSRHVNYNCSFDT
jgi:hypothetical protein